MGVAQFGGGISDGPWYKFRGGMRFSRKENLGRVARSPALQVAGIVCQRCSKLTSHHQYGLTCSHRLSWISPCCGDGGVMYLRRFCDQTAVGTTSVHFSAARVLQQPASHIAQSLMLRGLLHATSCFSLSLQQLRLFAVAAGFMKCHPQCAATTYWKGATSHSHGPKRVQWDLIHTFALCNAPMLEIR